MLAKHLFDMELQIIKIVEDTTVDGPGWRSSVYCAGCRHMCKGCHNPETWSFTMGERITTDELIRRLSETEPTNGITLSGGDPMYQAEAFTEVARRIKEELHRNLWCFTGFLYEEVLADPVMSAMLPYLDVLVDGPFIEAEKDDTLMFRGSRNQRLIDVQASLQSGCVVLFPWNPDPVFA